MLRHLDLPMLRHLDLPMLRHLDPTDAWPKALSFGRCLVVDSVIRRSMSYTRYQHFIADASSSAKLSFVNSHHASVNDPLLMHGWPPHESSEHMLMWQSPAKGTPMLSHLEHRCLVIWTHRCLVIWTSYYDNFIASKAYYLRPSYPFFILFLHFFDELCFL